MIGVAGAAGGNNSDPGATDRAAASARGKWTDCPAFGLGARYSLAVHNTSDARLSDAYDTKPVKLDYLSSAPLPVQVAKPAASAVQPAAALPTTKVHVTSSPEGGEIYVDGKHAVGYKPSGRRAQFQSHTGGEGMEPVSADQRWRDQRTR